MTTQVRKYYATEDLDLRFVREYDGYAFGSQSSTRSLNSQISTERTKSGGSNPSWRDLIKNHQEATTTFVGVAELIESKGSGSWQCTVVEKDNPFPGYNATTKVKGRGYLSFSGAFVPPGGEAFSDASLQARQSAIKTIVNHTRTFNTSVFLGEIRQTLQMVRKPGKALQDLIMGEQFHKTRKRLKTASTRRGRPLGWLERKRSLQKAASDSWLENSFGWAPLINDIEDGLSVLKHYAENPPIVYQTLEARGYSRSNQSSVTRTDDNTTGTYIRYDVEQRTYHEAAVRIYGELFRVAGVKLPAIGLSWGNFIPTVWELLPYSFLIDYFTNISEVLDSAFIDISAVGRASTAWRHEGVREFQFLNFRPTAGTFESIQASGSHPNIKMKSRQVGRFVGANLTSLPLRFNFRNSALHWANMGALAVSMYKGLSRDIAL